MNLKNPFHEIIGINIYGRMAKVMTFGPSVINSFLLSNVTVNATVGNIGINFTGTASANQCNPLTLPES
ncbi:hypothetical protein, partial [Methanopyrus sp.]